jgi:para-nitrobenzyl esterase
MSEKPIDRIGDFCDARSFCNLSVDRRIFLKRSLVGGGGSLMASALLGGLSRRWAFAADASPIVETTAGKVRGSSLNGVQMFKGIHYGASTAGSMRFLPPVAAKSWTGVRDALEYGPPSPQDSAGQDLADKELQAAVAGSATGFGRLLLGPGTMSEDCLVLNVWTPSLPPATKKPVMFWLHGGGFAAGSDGRSWFDGSNLARKHDVVVVGINHRLNVFGYLYLAQLGGAKYADSGNAGMLDIVLALRWVRDNIANFGGDPGNVTIFGQSGGGGKVSILMAMPAAKGLFHKAIVESGSTLRVTPAATATDGAQRILDHLGLKGNQVDRLQELSMDQLLKTVREVSASGPLPLSPVLDGHAVPRNPFDPTAPEISAGVPMLIGTNATETTLLIGGHDPAAFSLTDASLHARLKTLYKLEDPQISSLIDTYRKDQPDASPSLLFFTITSDRQMRMNAITQAERKLALGAAPAYMYYFKWQTPVLGGRLHTPHDTEMLFVFDNVAMAPTLLGRGADLQPLADKVSGAWTSFARTGDPSQKNLPWPAYNTRDRPTMVFNDQCKIVNDPGKQERLEWMKLWSTAG